MQPEVQDGWLCLNEGKKKFFLEKLRVQQWKGQENREICSLTVLVHCTTHIKRYGFISLKNLTVKKDNVEAFDIYGQVH